MQKIPAMPESYGGSLFKASRKSALTSRMRCIRSFSWRKSSGLIPRKVCFAILSIWSRISRSSSSRSSSTLGPSIIHPGLEGSQSACRLIPIVHRSGREVCLSTFLSTRAKLTSNRHPGHATPYTQRSGGGEVDREGPIVYWTPTNDYPRRSNAIVECKLLGPTTGIHTAKPVFPHLHELPL